MMEHYTLVLLSFPRASILSCRDPFPLQVAMVTGLCEQTTFCVRSLPTLQPSPAMGSRRRPRPCNRQGDTCKPQIQDPNNKHLARHSRHQLPRNQHLPLHQRAVSDYYSNPMTFGSLQNSGRHSARTPPLCNGPVNRTVSEKPGVLRSSRRRRGLPPDTTLLNGVLLDGSSSKKCRTVPLGDGDVPPGSEIPRREDRCGKDVSHVGGIPRSHERELEGDACGRVGETRAEGDSCVGDDQRGRAKIEELTLTSVSALEPSEERVYPADTAAHCDLGHVGEDPHGHARDERCTLFTTTTDPGPVSRAAAARTPMIKAALNSVTTDPPASCSATHTPKATGKNAAKCTPPAISCSIHDSNGAAKDSSEGSTEDPTEDRSCPSTSKGSAKGLAQTRSTTSAIKTRTSPRTLLKR